MQFRKKDLITIPNILTYIRILLVPVFVVVYLKYQTWPGNLRAIVVVAASAVTDVVDGVIARRTGQITDLGKIIDPIADKAMEFAMMFCIVSRYPLVSVLIIIFAIKELVSLGFSSFLLAHGKNIGGAKWCGKLCTVILYAAMIAFIILPKIKHPIDQIMVAVTAAVMLLAFIVYMNAYINLLREYRSEKN